MNTWQRNEKPVREPSVTEVDGRWEGRHIVGYDENGKAITKSVLAKTKLACVEKLKKLQSEHSEAEPDKLKSNMRFGDCHVLV